MSGLPDILRITDEPEKLSLPPASLLVAQLIKFQLPHHHKRLYAASGEICDFSRVFGPFRGRFGTFEYALGDP
jgi:hypothetical protein